MTPRGFPGFGAGYTVDVQRANRGTLDNAKIAALNAADLIIVSRTTSSGNYNTDATEIGQWSAITTPMINLSAYFVRNNRWFWVNTATVNSLVGPMMEVVTPAHPIFTGVKLNAANQVAVVDGTTGTGQTSFIGMTDVGSGTLLAKTGANAWIVEWQPGKPFYTGAGQTRPASGCSSLRARRRRHRSRRARSTSPKTARKC